MRIVSVNVAMPTPIVGTARGTVSSAIYKRAVEGPVVIGTTNLAGDIQGDLENHGGPLKAIYAYAVSDYDFWRSEGLTIPEFGWFGENLSVEGVTGEDVRTGDVWEVGTAVLQATEPRSPCYKLDHKIGIARFAARFQRTGRVGFYLRVLQEGVITAGDTATLVQRTPGAMTIRELSDFRHYGTGGRPMATRIMELDSIGPPWRTRPRRLLASTLAAKP
jgi:MOSC domain-containing protein YiiM